MKYSYNLERNGIVFAGAKDINASFKDLCAVCDAIRHRGFSDALAILEEASRGERAIFYRRHNKYMGSRHELGGRKGRFPAKCSAIVRKVLVNAGANATNKGEDPESMVVVHAAANKTLIAKRTAPKGIRNAPGHAQGRVKSRRSDLEFARVEIGIKYSEDGKAQESERGKARQKDGGNRGVESKVS